MISSLRIAAALAVAMLATACASAGSSAPNDGAAYASFLVGELASRRADHGAASDSYYEALGRRPGDVALMEGALGAALASGDAARARAIARAAEGEAPAFAHLVRAADDVASGRLRQARAEIEALDGDAAAELAGGMLLVWVRTGEGHVDDVLIDLEPLASVRPYGGLFAYQQAMAFDLAGRGEEALEAYRLAEASELWLPAAVERHADFLARHGARDQARALLRASDARTANPALEHAMTRIDAGQTPAAAQLTPARGAAIALQGIAAIFLQERDAANGLATLTLALMLDPSLDSARIAYADAQSNLGHVEEARAMLASIARDSAYARAARGMEAWVLMRAERRDEALALARANAEADPKSRRALADIYRSLDRWGDAEPIYSALLSEDPESWRLHFARGAARQRLDRWAEAEADLLRALQLEPDQADVLNYLGYSWVERGEHLDRALAMIESAVRQRPTNGLIIDSLGWAHFRMGDYEQAVEVLEHAVELEPANAVINDHLGDAYWRADRRLEARYQWRRALGLEPMDAAAIEAKLAEGLPDLAPTRSATR